jgi:hypothetical protein
MDFISSTTDEIINMNLKTYQEASDMLIALYGYHSPKDLGVILENLTKHYFKD